MLPEKSFYGLDNWKCFQTKSFSPSSLLSFKKDVIFQENNRGFVVLFIEKKVSPDNVTLECYKKHSTAIIKSILIGKFPIPIYNNFKTEIDNLVKQTAVLEDYIKKPEFAKYKLQKRLYFNLD